MLPNLSHRTRSALTYLVSKDVDCWLQVHNRQFDMTSDRQWWGDHHYRAIAEIEIITLKDPIRIFLVRGLDYRSMMWCHDVVTAFTVLITRSHDSDQCCKGDASSQWEKANLPLSPHPQPLTDSHQILHTWLRPPYLPTSDIWSRSPQGLLLPI